MIRILSITIYLVFSVLSLKSQTNSIVINTEFRATSLCSSDTNRNVIVYNVREDILRVDLKGPYSQSSMIYQPSSDMIWVLHHVEKAYFTMTRTELKTYEAVVLEQSDLFEKEVNKMDAKGQKEVKTIWSSGNPFIFEEPEYELVRKKDSLISQLVCNKYHGKNKNGHDQYMYLSDLKPTGIKMQELETLKGFSEILGKGVKGLIGNMDFTTIYEREQGGLPILLEKYQGALICTKYWIRNIYRKKLENEFFTVPIHYTKMLNPLGY